MTVSPLDIVYRRLVLTKLFSRGWGDPDHLSRLLDFRQKLSQGTNFVPADYRIEIIRERKVPGCTITEGKFLSPLAGILPDVLPEAIKIARFQMYIPDHWNDPDYKPVCIHLAGTGDHYFWKRRSLMVKPLLKRGIGSILLENPYYGYRKPKEQLYSSLLYVRDVFVMGAMLILECIVLLNMCEKHGYGPLGVTGISMGGHMASLVAAHWRKPLVLVPCLSWSTASSVFTEGVMSNSIVWDDLERQYISNEKYHQILAKNCRIFDDPTRMKRLPHCVLSTSEFQTKFQHTRVTPYEILEFMSKNGILPTIEPVKFCSPETTANATVNKLIQIVFNEKRAMKLRDKHAMWFMRGLMDEFTHLNNFPKPVDTSLIIGVCAKQDAYVIRESVTNLQDIWPGSTIKYLECGHISAIIKNLDFFRKTIVEAFDKSRQKLTVRTAIL